MGEEPITYSRRDNARRGAQTTLGRAAKDGVDFFVVRVSPNNWAWKTAAEVTDRERAAWSRRNKETPMANEPTNVTPIRKDPMPALDPKLAAADPSRKPTRLERSTIRDELTRIYDIDQERYAGGDSDKSVAERLNVPRAWVSTIRDEDFGDHDRNQASQQKVLKLDAAITMARDATAKLLQMAQDAEALEKDLTAARKLLED